MEKLGFGFDEVGKYFIYGWMIGWGQEGFVVQMVGYDMIYLVLIGMLNMFGVSGKLLYFVLNYVVDFGGGVMFFVFGILVVVIECMCFGKGQVVDVVMVDGVVVMGGLIYMLIVKGLVGEMCGQNFLDGLVFFYWIYECVDGVYVVVGCFELQFFVEFLWLVDLLLEDVKLQ